VAHTTDLIVEIDDVERTYEAGASRVAALAGLSLEVRRGEFLAIMGPSGSGKSTLLNILAGLERPTAGRVVVDGVDLGTLDENGLARYRRGNVGMIFQAFNLLPRYRVIDNVAFPLLFAGVALDERLRRAAAILERLGMAPRAGHHPSQLSGGELQRTAIARALITDPALLLADEPTGNLDSANGAALLGLLSELHDKGQTIVLVTHDEAIARRAQRILRMRDGRLVA
jgi:putative ABC transport system ATP-binding protein